VAEENKKIQDLFDERSRLFSIQNHKNNNSQTDNRNLVIFIDSAVYQMAQFHIKQ